MTVDLLLVLLLYAEDDLCRHNSLIRVHEMEVWVETEGRSVLEKVSGDRSIVHCVLHEVTVLVHSQQCETVKDTRVDFFSAVRDNANNHLGFRYSVMVEMICISTFFHASFPQVREFFREHR